MAKKKDTPEAGKKQPDNAYVQEMMALDLEGLVKDSSEMTEPEMVFMNIYLRLLGADNPMAMQLAIDRAGFQFKADQVKIVVGNRILAKFQGKKDHKEVMRLAGWGPLQITMQLKHLSCNSKSDTARVQALNISSKCHDMQKSVLEVGQGVDIIIKRNKGEGLESPVFEKDMGAKAGKDKERIAPAGKVIRLDTTPKE